ncbi:sensor histidine kinase [Agromyces aurantiacus]|uniref:histidine kinase n=1 Tax=Agromyces aurantiacus TaxID=165814 RepID=A0ABV9R4A7_9MICO|nr:sensor histidine kinase [Agromyces aurantiacus]MBM7503631.1 signal transduction histidine kinase [Agromyces aurantiacus]
MAEAPDRTTTATLDRRWVCLATLGPIGLASLAYIVVVRGFVDAGVTDEHGLAWPLLGALPLFVFGMWLLTVSASRIALLIALGATAMLVGSAYETFVNHNLAILTQPWFPLFNVVGLTADAMATSALLIVFATFPDGVPERRWERIAVVFMWTPVLVGPLTLLTTPHVVTPMYLGFTGEAFPNPFAVPWLEWAAPAVASLVVQPWPAVVLGFAVLVSRAVFGTPDVRARTRVMALTVAAAMLVFAAWSFLPDLPVVEVAVYASMIAIPVAAIHGILRYGAFDIGPGERGARVERSSNLLITVVYAAGVATPAVLLVPPLQAVPAILLTTLLAVALLPVRGWMQRRLHRALFGDRERQFGVLSELGARLEQAGDPGDLLAHLASAVRDGLDASWVRIRLAGADGAFADSPVGVAGAADGPGSGPAGEPALSCDLVRGDERLGRIDVGPRRRGEYGDAERTLLRTVAGQAAASVANVGLTAQLAEQLDELTASRERLVAAQDDERRRLERDLHDGIQQDIVAQIAGLRLARNRLERGELAPDELAELQDHARETLTELRELARGIHPPVLSDNGLVAAVESGVARYPIPLDVEADAAVRAERYPEEVETTAYYVVREALANTAKHAHATHASVGLARDDGHLRIAISDDGCGIEPGVAGVSHGGLANIRDRVAALRGTISIAPNRPSGTMVLVELPVGERDG